MWLYDERLRRGDGPDDYGIHFPIVSMHTGFEQPLKIGDVFTTSIDPDTGDRSPRLEFTATDAAGNVRFRA